MSAPGLQPIKSTAVEHDEHQPNSRIQAAQSNSQPATGTASDRIVRPEPTRSVRAGRKLGQKNYSGVEIEKLLEKVEDVVPLGSNHWAVAGQRYNDWAVESGAPCRDNSMLKQKFDQLASTNKSNGYPTFPPEVRKHWAEYFG